MRHASPPPRTPRVLRALTPLAWVGPAIALIAVVVLWPVVVMIQSSFQRISRFGVVSGPAGLDNYAKLFAEPGFAGVLARSLLWVAAVVGLTVLLSLGLAALFNQRFPGRRPARWALIAPWAASVLMTAIVVKWLLDPEVGLVNLLLRDLGVLESLGGAAADPLGTAATAFPWLIAVAVFVSLPFTTYALLAGLATIPAEVYEAARIDGAGRLRTYRSVTLPLLRPALTVATLINVMNVFNSFPIIWVMTHGQPGYSTATSTVFMYLLKGSDIGESAAMSVVNFALVAVLTAVFLKVGRWRQEVAR